MSTAIQTPIPLPASVKTNGRTMRLVERTRDAAIFAEDGTTGNYEVIKIRVANDWTLPTGKTFPRSAFE